MSAHFTSGGTTDDRGTEGLGDLWNCRSAQVALSKKNVDA
jgi:hypothetical protein